MTQAKSLKEFCEKTGTIVKSKEQTPPKEEESKTHIMVKGSIFKKGLEVYRYLKKNHEHRSIGSNIKYLPKKNILQLEIIPGYVMFDGFHPVNELDTAFYIESVQQVGRIDRFLRMLANKEWKKEVKPNGN